MDEAENAAPERKEADEPLPVDILAHFPEPMRVWHLARMVAKGRLSFEEALERLRRASAPRPEPPN